MKLFLDFFALILFFGAYYFTRDIYTATIVAVIAGVIQAALVWLKYRKLETMQIVSTVLIVVFGGATIYLKNPLFIQWKPSLLFWTMAAAVAGGLIFKKNVLKSLLGKEITLPEKVWHNLALSWLVFFAVMGAVNLFVAYRFSEETWVTYKTFGAMGLMLLFFLAQGVYMARYLPQDMGEKA